MVMVLLVLMVLSVLMLFMENWCLICGVGFDIMDFEKMEMVDIEWQCIVTPATPLIPPNSSPLLPSLFHPTYDSPATKIRVQNQSRVHPICLKRHQHDAAARVRATPPHALSGVMITCSAPLLAVSAAEIFRAGHRAP
jgi:hypothetical protein